MVMADGFLRFRQQTSKDAPHGAVFVSEVVTIFVSTSFEFQLKRTLNNSQAILRCAKWNQGFCELIILMELLV